MESGRVPGFLKVHAEIDQVAQHLHVFLRRRIPPMTPNASHGRPSFVTNPGMIV
jgi:hypothetical protein